MDVFFVVEPFLLLHASYHTNKTFFIMIVVRARPALETAGLTRVLKARFILMTRPPKQREQLTRWFTERYVPTPVTLYESTRNITTINSGSTEQELVDGSETHFAIFLIERIGRWGILPYHQLTHVLLIASYTGAHGIIERDVVDLWRFNKER